MEAGAGNASLTPCVISAAYRAGSLTKRKAASKLTAFKSWEETPTKWAAKGLLSLRVKYPAPRQKQQVTAHASYSLYA